MQEIPMIDFTGWTQKNLRDDVFISDLLKVMHEINDSCNINTIYAGEGTKCINKIFDISNTKDLEFFSKCMKNKNILTICLSNSDKKKKDIYFGLTICFAPEFNVISFDVSHSYFLKSESNNNFLDICKNLIEIFEPYYANIDDMENSIKIMDRMAENGYKTLKYIPAIFWGNYFGEKYIEEYGREKLLDSPVRNIESLGNGIMITMNDNLIQYDTKQCEDARKKLSKYLGIGKYRLF